MSYCFLYNPSTNRRRSYRIYKQLKELTGGWAKVCHKTSESPEHLKQLAKEAAQKYEVVVACGGDGTVRDVAIALMESQAKLGVIPVGSGNDFSKSLGLTSDLEEALTVLRKAKSRAVAIGKCNDYYFINTLGFGFDGKTNSLAAQSAIRYGPLRYGMAALKTNLRMEPFTATISIDKHKLEDNRWIMIAAANGRVEGGNFIIAPDASLFDDRLRLITIKPISKWILPFLLTLFLIGKHRWLPYIGYYEAEKIALEFNRSVYIHSDGEQIHTRSTKFDIRILPSAIQVIC